jgi:hypothetical protein
VPTAILSRQVGVTRGASLILNLPGQPKAIKETLDGVFAAVPYCIDLIGGPYLEARRTRSPCSAPNPRCGRRHDACSTHSHAPCATCSACACCGWWCGRWGLPCCYGWCWA